MSKALKAGAVSTLAGGGGAGFADGQGAAARFNSPLSVVVTANGDYVLTDFGNHALRVQARNPRRFSARTAHRSSTFEVSQRHAQKERVIHVLWAWLAAAEAELAHYGAAELPP